MNVKPDTISNNVKILNTENETRDLLPQKELLLKYTLALNLIDLFLVLKNKAINFIHTTVSAKVQNKYE
jgi:hypothetical protein